MPKNLFVIPLCVELTNTGAARQSVHTIAFEYSGNSGVSYFDAVIALQIPNDTHRPEMVIATKMQNLFFDLWRRAVAVLFRYRRTIDQPVLTMLGEQLSPTLECRPSLPKVAAGFDHRTILISVFENA